MKTWKYVATVVMLWVLGFLTCRAMGVPTWSNPVGGSNFVYSGDEVRWGVALDQEQSGLAWTELPESTGVFPLGVLEHFNYVVQIGTAPTAIDLSTHGMLLTLLVDETPNNPGPGDDYIRFPAVLPSTGNLTLLGFGQTPDSIVSEFSSPENQTNWTYLWASKPIPAPGAICLAVVGVLGVMRKRFAW